MAHRQSLARRWGTATRWPVGIALTSWRYMWRTTPVHRRELTGALPDDFGPPLPDDANLDDLQPYTDGVGELVHRIYRVQIIGSTLTPEELMAQVAADLDSVAPSEFATFQKLGGDGPLAFGDEYLVRMPGPWDGPVRVVARGPTSFRFVTLRGHLEAGQIEFRTRADFRSLAFEIESWARSGDRLADALYSHLRLAKEIQLHMWTSVLERVARLAGGHPDAGVVITTRRIPAAQVEGAADSERPLSRRTRARLDRLRRLRVNFDPRQLNELSAAHGWRRDDMVEALPHEASGAPAQGGSWQIARRLMVDYQLADPHAVRASYDADAPLEGRDMLLRIRFGWLRFHVGVRVGEVYEESREVDGRPALVFGWYYRTLEGHFEQGQMNYELWKWLDNGDVEFRLFAVSRPAHNGPWLLRTGFRLFGRTSQLRFYRQVCRRARLLTEAQLETRAVSAGSAAATRLQRA